MLDKTAGSAVLPELPARNDWCVRPDMFAKLCTRQISGHHLSDLRALCAYLMIDTTGAVAAFANMYSAQRLGNLLHQAE